MSLKISVLTPSYNSAKYLDRAIQSVNAQDYTNWEHIVMDADSQDGTKEILANYPHLIWQSEPDKGQSDAMNKAFAKSTGDIIVYLNADDYFKEGAFRAVIDAFVAKSTCDMVVASLEMILPDGQKQIHNPSILLDDILVYNEFRFPLNPVSYFYKRKVQLEVGEFPIDNHFTMDYWFLLRAYKNIVIQKLDFVTGVFVQDGANKSAQIQKSQMSLYKTWKEFVSTLPKEKHDEAELKLFQTFALNVQNHNETNEKLSETWSDFNKLSYRLQALSDDYQALNYKYEESYQNNQQLLEQNSVLTKENKTLYQLIGNIESTKWWRLGLFLKNFVSIFRVKK